MNCRTVIQALLTSVLLSTPLSSAEVVKSVSTSSSKSTLRGEGRKDVYGERDVVHIQPVVIERYLNGTGK